MTYRSKSPAYESRYGKLYRLGYRTQVPAEVAARKVRALCAIGHTHVRISQETGVGDRQYVSHIANGSRKRLTKAKADAIDAYYEANQHNPLDTTDARRAKSFAKKRGWAVPAAWDHIEDINDSPKGLRK